MNFRLQLSLTFFTVSDHTSTFYLTFFESFLHWGLRLGGSSHLEPPSADWKGGEVTGGCGLSTSGRWCGIRERDGCRLGVPLSPHALDEFHLDFAPKGICQKQLPICTLGKPEPSRPQQPHRPQQSRASFCLCVHLPPCDTAPTGFFL